MVEKIKDQSINLDDFDRKQEVRRVYVNDGGELRLQEQVWTMNWNLEKKREVAADLKSDDYIAYVAWEDEKIIGFVSVVKELTGHRMVMDFTSVIAFCFEGNDISKFSLSLPLASILITITLSG